MSRNRKFHGGKTGSHADGRLQTQGVTKSQTRNTPVEGTSKAQSAVTKAPVQKEAVTIGTFPANRGAGWDNNIERNSYINPGRVQNQTFGNFTVTAENVASRTPNGMALWMDHYFGANFAFNHKSSPINQAAYRIKQFIDTKFGYKENYAADDIAIYIMAVSDVIEKVVELKRDICLKNMARIHPGFFPDGIYDMLGIIFDETTDKPGMSTGRIAGNATYWMDELNRLINTINGLPLPAELGVLTVNNDVYSCLYADTPDTENAQIYAFASNSYWLYNEETGHDGSKIEYHTWADTIGSLGGKMGSNRFRRIQDRLDTLFKCVDRITRNTQSQTMLQDLLNAYGTGAMLELELGSSLDQVDIVYDENMLKSIENATLVDGIKPYAIAASVNVGGVIGVPIVTEPDNHYGVAVDIPLQFHTDCSNISEDDVAYALRFHPHFNETGVIQNVPNVEGAVPVENVEGIYSNGMYGFALLIKCTISVFSGIRPGVEMFTRYEVTRRTYNMMDVINMFGDFAHAPILIDADLQITGEGRDAIRRVVVKSYTAARDTELTVPYVYLEQWYRGICENAWQSNLIRDLKGQRAVMG